MTEPAFDMLFPEDTLQDLETGVGICFSNKIYTDNRSFGELFDHVWDELAPYATVGGRCPTTASFYKLKRLIERQCPGQILSPGTRFVELKGFSYATLLEALRYEKWRAPSRGVRPAAWLSGFTMATAAAWVTGLSETLLLILWFAVFASTVWASHKWVFRKSWHVEFRELGDLAHYVAQLNLRRLRNEGATGLNRTIVWKMLTAGMGPVERSAVYIWDF